MAIFTTVPTATTSVSGTYNATVPARGVTLTTPYDTNANSALVSIPVNITLPAAGTYYIAVEADNSLSANGEVAVYSTQKGFLGAPAPFPAGGENDFDFNPNPGLFGSVITGETGDAAYKITAQAATAGVPEPSTWALLGWARSRERPASSVAVGPRSLLGPDPPSLHYPASSRPGDLPGRRAHLVQTVALPFFSSHFHEAFRRLSLFALALGVSTAAHAGVVLNQILPPASYPEYDGYTSQRFTDAGYAYANSAVVDDFTVTGSTLDLNSISAVVTGFGFYFSSFSKVSGWEVDIYSSLTAARTNVAGDVYDVTISVSAATVGGTYAANGDNDALLTLPVNLVLPAAGTYYLGVVAQNSIYGNGEIGIYDGGTAGGFNAHQEDPGAAANFGGVTETAIGADAAYEIIGGPAAAPEPSVWTMLAIGGLGAAFLVRRRTRA